MTGRKGKERFSKNIFIKNKKASYEYELIEKHTAGIVLMGTEIKSIREGKASLQEAYCYFKSHEMFIKQMNIKPYANAGYTNHEAQRERKLLLRKSELSKIKSKMDEKGLTLVPTALYINKKGLAKLDFALAKGKKLYDKRDDLKKKDLKREIERSQY
jgi:SsrA-binding protein